MASALIRMLYRDLPVSLLASAVISVLTAFVLWRSLPLAQTVGWLIAMFVMLAARTGLLLTFRRARSDAAVNPSWGRWGAVGAGATGLVWGLGSFLLYVPEATHYQFLLLFVIMSAAASAVYALSAYVPALIAFLLGILAPTALSMALRGDTLHYVLAGMTVCYFFMTVMFGRRFHQSIIESLQLRFENIGLVEELTRKKDEAERANIAKSRFLAAASHDLRQPVHALNLFVQMLRQGQLTPEDRRLVDNIGTSVDAMGGLFDALLDISKLDAQVVQPELRHFALEGLMSRLASELEAEAAVKGLNLRLRDTRGALVHSDPVLLERIVRNLVTNAVRHTVRGKVLVGCRRRGSTWRIEVWDTGPGIPPENLQDIFQEYFQLGNAERDRSKGLGLGLAICDRLARLLGSRIDVRSVPGRGSMFAVQVPVGDERRVSPRTDIANEEVAPASAQGLIVVIEDEAPILEGMRALLSSWGYDAIASTSREAALQVLAQQVRAPDLVISDYRLSGDENGVQAILAMQEEFNAAIPGILITGDTGPERLREAQASGFTLLHKPVPPARLRSVIEGLIQA